MEHMHPSNSYGNLDEVSAPEKKIAVSPQGQTGGHAGATETAKSLELANDGYGGLDELADPAPDQNPNENSEYQRDNLEDERLREQRYGTQSTSQSSASRTTSLDIATRFVVISYLVLFSILGTLARLGLQILTRYPGAPVANTELWANVGGCLVMGFIKEDRLLFRRQWLEASERKQLEHKDKEEEHHDDSQLDVTEETTAAYAASRATIPAYIGITVGFCGSFTSFSSFIRDAFLALSDDLNTGLVSTAVTTSISRSRPAGYSVMAVLAVLIVEICMSLAALSFGAHLATLLHPFANSLPSLCREKVHNTIAIVLGWGCWLGAILMAILPPDRFAASTETWRGYVLFALVFAPFGCLLRFQLSIVLNRRIRSFPLGTFVANTLGTLILGLCFDLQRSPLASVGGRIGGGLVGCQVLQGIQDGFCGCLTTVSTWVLELQGLRRSHSYFYGSTSVGVSLMLLVVIIGTLRWSVGLAMPACKF